MAEYSFSASLAPSTTASGPRSPPMTSTTMRINKKSVVNVSFGHALKKLTLTECLDGDHLAALVETASGTNAVRHERCGTLRAGAQLWERQNAVVRPAHALAAVRRFSL